MENDKNRESATPGKLTVPDIRQEMLETTDLPLNKLFHEQYLEMCKRERTQSVQIPVAQIADTGNQTPVDPRGRQVKISCPSCGQKLDVTPIEPFSHIACPACGNDLIVPKWFDNYLLEESGGSGGMATVYRALDLALDREVAIKVLKPELAVQVDKSELFLHEARTAATINHYAVIPIYTCGMLENQTYIVMQYMGGGSLEQALRTAAGPLPLLNVIHWIRDVASGLENAYRHNVIHHDIKPANIMLDTEGKAKIGDFGIAQVISGSAEDASAAAANAWVSPHYVSPEKVLTGREDVRGDVYSLGATFYHLLTGYTPFSNSDVDELIRMRITTDPMLPYLQRENIPEQLSFLVMSMLSRTPSDRPDYPTIIEILNEYINDPELLEVKMNQTQHPTRPTAPRKKNTAPPGVAAKKRPMPPPPVQKKKPSGFVAFMKLLLQLLILVAIIGTAIYFLDKGGKLNAFVGYMPAFMQAEKKPLTPEVRLNSQLVQYLRDGLPELVLSASAKQLNGSERQKRIQAALQVCYAAYLGDVEIDPKEYAAKIYDALDSDMTAYERIVFEDNLELIRLMSGKVDEKGM